MNRTITNNNNITDKEILYIATRKFYAHHDYVNDVLIDEEILFALGRVIKFLDLSMTRSRFEVLKRKFLKHIKGNRCVFKKPLGKRSA